MNTTINALFQPLSTPDRSKTQLAYKANYFPRKQLDDEAGRLICWHSRKMLYKAQILVGLNEDMTMLNYAPHNKLLQTWAIHWEFNNIPTQLEWERKSDTYIIECDFRVIVDGSRIVLLSFR